MEKSNHDDPEELRDRPNDDPAGPDIVSFGEQADDLLTRAVTDALAEGMSWAKIGARLGVPPPDLDDHGEVSDWNWQEAFVAHENARATRSRYDNDAAGLPNRHPE